MPNQSVQEKTILAGLSRKNGSGGGVASVTASDTTVVVDNTDIANPKVSASGAVAAANSHSDANDAVTLASANAYTDAHAGGSALHYRRDDLVSIGNETFIKANQDVYEKSAEISKNGTLLPLTGYVVSGTGDRLYTLAASAVAAEKYAVRYWSASPTTTATVWGLILRGTFPSGGLGSAYSQTLDIVGGIEPYSLTGGTGVSSGSLPAGLALSITGTTGAYKATLAGTPTTAATYSFTTSIDSTDGQTATSPQSVVIAVTTDPYFLNVVALLHMNGSSGSTTFTDVTGRTWASVGGTINTTYSEFGSGSGEFPVNSISPIYSADTTDIQMGTSDFTIEGWFMPVGTPPSGLGLMYTKGVNTTGGMLLGVLPTGLFLRCNGTTDTTVSTTISSSVFSHIVFQRASGVVSMYVAGSRVFNGSVSFDNNDTAQIYVGSYGGSPAFAYGGYIDDFRITKGVARYSGTSFTPPTAAFPDS